MTSSELVVLATIWLLTGAGVWFGLRAALRRRSGKGRKPHGKRLP